MKSDGILNIQEFKAYLADRGYADSTVEGYSIGASDFIFFLTKQGKTNFSIKDINEYFSSIKGSAQTVNTKKSALKKFLDFIKEKHLVSVNWKPDMEKCQNKRSTLILTPQDINGIISNISKDETKYGDMISSRNRLLFLFLYYTGAKTKQILNLQTNDVKAGVALAGDQEIMLNDIIIREYKKLCHHLRDNSFIFFSYAGKSYNFNKSLTERSVQQIFNKYAKSVNSLFNIIDLRNSFVSSIMGGGLNREIHIIHHHNELIHDGDLLNLLKDINKPCL